MTQRYKYVLIKIGFYGIEETKWWKRKKLHRVILSEIIEITYFMVIVYIDAFYTLLDLPFLILKSVLCGDMVTNSTYS